MIVPELTDRLPRPQRQSPTLACVEFSSTPSTDSPALIHTGLPPVDDIPLYETWPSSVESPETGNDSGWSYRHDGQNLFAWSYLSEADNIEDQTKQKYRSLLSLLDALRFPYLIKVWHYVPGLCTEQNGVNRYRLFCRGRAAAVGHRLDGEHLNAATVIGTQSAQGVFYCLAGRIPGRPLENPRQTAAYKYPDYAAAERPLFARGIVLQDKPFTQLYVSGTASIVGHQSHNIGDVGKQTRTAAEHVLCLLREAARLEPRLAVSCQPLIHRLNFYCVKREHRRIIQDCAQELLPQAQHTGFFYGDVCRPELLVEICLLYTSPSPRDRQKSRMPSSA